MDDATKSKGPEGERAGTSRRDFIGLAAAAGLSGLYAISAVGQDEETPPASPPVGCAVIGLGLQGRKILSVLARSESAHVAGFCELYDPYLKRGARTAPEAQSSKDYRQTLGAPGVEAVFVTTPTHLHREIVEAGLAAGKHVYCEAPMASTVEDARAIAEAAAKSDAQCCVGLQLRANPHYKHALDFIKIRAVGALVSSSGYQHMNASWRRSVGDPAFREAMNWKLSPDVSLGLMGEAGVHDFDTALRFLKEVPAAVTSFGSIMKWNDGRTTPDTVQCVFEFPTGFQLRFEGTLTNSHGGKSHTIHGTHGSVFLTEKRCWMFKEADAPSLGWEVYAMRERVATEDGIVLVANATKLLERDQLPGEGAAEELAKAKDSVEIAVESFLNGVRAGAEPFCGPAEGYRSVVMAAAAKRSLQEGKRVEIDPSLFEV